MELLNIQWWGVRFSVLTQQICSWFRETGKFYLEVTLFCYWMSSNKIKCGWIYRRGFSWPFIWSSATSFWLSKFILTPKMLCILWGVLTCMYICVFVQPVIFFNFFHKIYKIICFIFFLETCKPTRLKENTFIQYKRIGFQPY